MHSDLLRAAWQDTNREGKQSFGGEYERTGGEDARTFADDAKSKLDVSRCFTAPLWRA